MAVVRVDSGNSPSSEGISEKYCSSRFVVFKDQTKCQSIFETCNVRRTLPFFFLSLFRKDLFFRRNQIKFLMLDGSSIFIDNLEFRFVVRTQFFISDLPARALFLRTVSFNGYYACHYCLTKGSYKSRGIRKSHARFHKIKDQISSFDNI